MSSPDIIEFYADDKILLRIDSSMVPSIGSVISIKKKTWTVAQVTFAIDYADKVFERQMRCNVELME